MIKTLPLLLLLSGCAPVVMVAGVAGTAAQVPNWINTAQTVISGVKTLTQMAQLACALQSAANTHGDSTTSYYAGWYCTW